MTILSQKAYSERERKMGERGRWPRDNNTGTTKLVRVLKHSHAALKQQRL